MVQGALVHWSEVISSPRPPPTAVLVHGILGSRKNMYSIARRLVQVLRSTSVSPPYMSYNPSPTPDSFTSSFPRGVAYYCRT